LQLLLIFLKVEIVRLHSFFEASFSRFIYSFQQVFQKFTRLIWLPGVRDWLSDRVEHIDEVAYLLTLSILLVRTSGYSHNVLLGCGTRKQDWGLKLQIQTWFRALLALLLHHSCGLRSRQIRLGVGFFQIGVLNECLFGSVCFFFLQNIFVLLRHNATPQCVQFLANILSRHFLVFAFGVQLPLHELCVA